MSLDGQLVAGDKKHGVPIGSLAGQNDPAVESRGIGAEVPFADDAGMVAAGLQALSDVVARAVEGIEDGHAVEVRVLAGQQRRAAGRADGIGDEGVCEPNAISGQSI